MNHLLRVICFFTCFCAAALAQPRELSPCSLVVTVVDPSGKTPVTAVIATELNSGSVVKTTTDPDGVAHLCDFSKFPVKLVIGNSQPGCYRSNSTMFPCIGARPV